MRFLETMERYFSEQTRNQARGTIAAENEGKSFMQRSCGVLYPISSLPSPYGIGSFSEEAREFIRFLKQAGQSAWQILPIGPTGFGDSPYASISAFAINPYFIDLDQLKAEGLLSEGELQERFWGGDPESVDYGALYQNRYLVLKIAADRFFERGMGQQEDYQSFCRKEQYWLEDYALFMAIKQLEHGKSWQEWDLPFKTRNKDALEQVEEEQKELISFIFFQQFEAEKMWNSLHEYAGEHGIDIIGDIPFYVSLDSADAWAHPDVFAMKKDRTPIEVAGCAPDAFSSTGQLWGNPVYDWKKPDHAMSWWMLRMKRSMEFYDVTRIDHFHGFSEYYAIPYGEKTAEHGTLRKGPGMSFFRKLKEECPSIRLIAEDLGNVTEENTKLLNDTGIPGMKILEYAFTSWNSIYLPYRYDHHCVVYTGTHDNPPVRAWIEELNDGSRDFLRRYLNSMNSDYGQLTWDLIREAYRSTADLCIIPIQDYLVKGREAQMNVPGTSGNSWRWRVLPGFLSDDLARSMHDLSALYGRLGSSEK